MPRRRAPRPDPGRPGGAPRTSRPRSPACVATPVAVRSQELLEPRREESHRLAHAPLDGAHADAESSACDVGVRTTIQTRQNEYSTGCLGHHVQRRAQRLHCIAPTAPAPRASCGSAVPRAPARSPGAHVRAIAGGTCRAVPAREIGRGLKEVGPRDRFEFRRPRVGHHAQIGLLHELRRILFGRAHEPRDVAEKGSAILVEEQRQERPLGIRDRDLGRGPPRCVRERTARSPPCRHGSCEVHPASVTETHELEKPARAPQGGGSRGFVRLKTKNQCLRRDRVYGGRHSRGLA